MTQSTVKLLVALGLCIASSFAARCGEQVVWQIGQPDKSYVELAIPRNYSAFSETFGRTPLVFEVGRSDPSNHWPFIHPSSADAWAGSREHPFTIRFQLTAPPRGLFLLKVDLVDVHSGSPPALVVIAGGQTGRFPLQPGGGDTSLGDPAAGKSQKIELAFPASFFHQGTNDIVLTMADGSWVLYDAITFANDPDVDTTQPEIRTVSVEPTPFYVRQNGKLRRQLDVNVTLAAPVADLVVSVQAGGETTEYPVNGRGGFAGIHTEITVPDFSVPTEVVITGKAGPHSKSTKVLLDPGIKWKVFVGASAHTDIGYTDLQPKCAERHNQNTDLAIGFLEQDPDFKWNLEVAWQAENYLATHQGEPREKFLRFAREGRLGVQALYANILTGLCSHEAGCRLTAYAHSLKTHYGIPYRSAMISDVPTQEATLPMFLANSGIRYFSSGINNDRAYPFNQMQEKCPCWWEGPDGSRVLMMYASMYGQASAWGFTRNVEAARARVLSQLKSYESRTNYPFDAVWLHGAIGDNGMIDRTLPDVVKAWNERYEFPRVILAHNAEFFEHIEKNFGDRLPVFRGSAGSYWEDGAGSSAQETKFCRNAQESLATAETLLAFARRVQPGKTPDPADELRDAWRNCLLYDEHTWGAHSSISEPDSDFTKKQWEIKARFATDADRQARSLLAQGTAALAALVRTEGRALVVINSASWPRTDILRVQLPAGTSVVERGVPVVEDSQGTLLLVKDVPACGYRTLKLGPKKNLKPAKPMEGHRLESRFYRVDFDPVTGDVVSLFDKELNQELVDSNAPYRLNQYLYVSGGKGSRTVMNENGPKPELVVSTPPRATLLRIRLGDLGERMIIESSATMTPRLVTEITVWNDLRRVDIVNRFTKTETYEKEAVYFAFPFAAETPTFRYECPAGIVNANTDMLPGACLDWFAVQHFVEVESASATIAWATPDAPLVCFQDINRGKWLRQLPMKSGHLYAYLLNNYWHTNYKAGQGGEHIFRFSITSRAKADNAASARFGWAASNPLLAVVNEAKPAASLPEKTGSFVDIAEPNVVLIGAKQSEDGGGLVLRLWETSGKATTAHVRLRHLPASKATAGNLVEDRAGALEFKNATITVPIRGAGLASVIIE